MNKKIAGIIIFVAIALVALIVLTGCESKKTIVGDWEYENGGYTYHFNEDGTGTYMDIMNLTYTENNGAVTITFEGMDNSLEGTWEGDVLNVKDSFGSDTIYKTK